MYLPRIIEQDVLRAMEDFPVVAITGPRQCGKSTLAKHLFDKADDVDYLDLERPSDIQRLQNAEWYLSAQKGKTICIDEIQRKPDLFPLIRTLVDEWDRPGSFLILGSASRDLLQQSSESLAGRIVYKRLTPFLINELEESCSLQTYLNRGGFPRSILAARDSASYEWLEAFISTFLERDLKQWAGFSNETMSRLWRMLAHLNGQTANYTILSSSLGVSVNSIRRYIDLLSSTYMVQAVTPYHSNLGKRLVRSPKLYLADSGITCALLGIESFEDLLGHPGLGALWEQVVLSNIIGNVPKANIYFYRTSNGAEIDFLVETNKSLHAIECKASHTPSLSRGNHNAIADTNLQKTFVVTPSTKNWSMNRGIEVVSLNILIEMLQNE